MRKIGFVIFISALLLAAGCGGGSSSSSSSSNATTNYTTSNAGGNTIVTSGNNVAPLVVDAGPTVPLEYSNVNVAFTTVVVCAPNTTNCVTIPDVQVDIGSTGLRIPASLLTALNLQNVNTTTPIAECVQFLDESYFWGSVQVADVKMGGANNTGEVASSVPIHVMGDTSLPTAPSSCSTVTEVDGTTTPGTEEDSVYYLGANGLLGVGFYEYDCDSLGLPTGVGSATYGIGAANACATSSTPPPGNYYTCPSSVCSPVTVTASEQIRNPVSMFTTTGDDNGVILELPQVQTGGVSSIPAGQGSLVFGIGTQSNNGLGSAVVLPLDSNYNDAAWQGITTVYKGVSYPHSTSTLASFLDSGSNGMYFLDEPTTGIATCDGGWYCPESTEALTAANVSVSGSGRETPFNVSNANNLLNTNDTAFSDLAATVPDPTTTTADGYFDWGLSFFFGRNVYTAIWGAPAPSGVPAGPFWAY